MSKIPVYLMPGLAASPSIFEKISLPEDTFTVHYLEWILPHKNESLQNYAQRMCELITQEDAILVGVSFGGILVQEMARIISVKKIIIISSIKSRAEMPLRLKLVNSTMAYKLLPYSIISNIDKWGKYAYGNNFVSNRLRLYDKYLNVRDKVYLSWAIENVVSWKESVVHENLVHIHGEKDEVFPVKNIENYISVPGGTHVMIIVKYNWLNEHLPKIILKK